jgi:heme/copper-type cytochrome/quinol oxidase subunit 3
MSEAVSRSAVPSAPAPPPRVHHVPRGTRELGMWLFLLTLALLFAASMIAYAIFRIMATIERENLPAVSNAAEDLGRAIPIGSIAIPWPLYLSTVVILLTGFLMQRALDHVRAERIDKFRNTLVATLAMSVVFVLIQTPALALLLMDRDINTTNGAMVGFLVFLIVLHAAHVIGGLVPLFKITLNAHAGMYDHEHYAPVKMITMYWHFLDAVWIVMFGVFLALR